MHSSKPILSYFEYLWNVEYSIQSAIAECYPRAWDENHITYSWIHSLLKTMAFTHVFNGGQVFGVAFDAFKAKGQLETNHGDVAVIVRMTFEAGQEIEGVAFLEAKKFDNETFAAIKWDQLERESLLTNHHRLLLYDTDAVSCDSNLRAHGCGDSVIVGLFDNCQSTVLPTEHAQAFGRRTRSLHALALPLSFQIVARYLFGLDLCFSDDIVKQVKAGAIGSVSYLLVANACRAVEREPTPPRNGIDMDAFTSIDLQAQRESRSRGPEESGPLMEM